MEIWKQLGEPYTNYSYEVSNLGRIRSGQKGWRFGRILSAFPDKNNYLRVNLYDNDGGLIQVPVHTLVVIAFLEIRPSGMTVNHKDADKSNNIPSNLEWVSSPDNTAHAKDLGIYKNTSLKGEQQNGAS